ncbi:MAG TPA: YdcF family protein [Terriglobales bacterium]|jgi:DUF218 domain|nr:YdcF family protein [Terriglobales bacterium]
MRFRLAAAILVLAILLARSGTYLVVDRPQKSDVVLVLAGETERRPNRGIELLRQAYAPKMILDVPESPQFYGVSPPALAQKLIDSLPQAKQITICTISGLSTKDESTNASNCIAATGAHSVLLVTSSFHTRRALSIFRHAMPGIQFSVAAVDDPRQFQSPWWRNRQWAKVNLEEWMRLAWWYCVDRWR